MDMDLDNFSIFLDNLSSHYLGCVTVSFLAVLLTWWFLPKYLERHSRSRSLGEDRWETEEVEEADSSDTNTGLLTRMKIARQEVIESQLTAGMSQEQLDEEKKTEADQLAAIFNLLREQEDKFKISSMDDVQSQLKLYRR